MNFLSLFLLGLSNVRYETTNKSEVETNIEMITRRNDSSIVCRRTDNTTIAGMAITICIPIVFIKCRTGWKLGT